MARVVFSSIVNEIRGKLNGSVFQGGPGGFQLRTRVKPRNPRSAYQQLNRSNIGYLSRLWAELTQTQRDTWLAPVSGYPNGLDRFVAVNSRVWQLGQPAVTTSPSSFNTTDVEQQFVSLTSSTFTLQLLTGTYVLPSNVYLIIMATRPLSAGATFIGARWRTFTAAIPPATDLGTAYSIESEYVARHGAKSAGKLIGIQYYLLNASTGEYGNIDTKQQHVS